MIKLDTFKHTLWCAHLFLVLSTNAATKTVLNLLDNGSPGSLRETIANASSGDTILFEPNGTIFLEATNGELVIDKSLTIDGQNKIIIDGQNRITTCLHVLAGDYNVNFLGLTIQHFSDEGEVGSEQKDVHGILVDEKITQCTVQNCIIQKLVSTNLVPAALYGIRVNSDITIITDSIITELTRGTSPGYTFGEIVGVRAVALEGSCSGNMVFKCWSGDSNQASASLAGLDIRARNNQATNWVTSDNKVFNCWTGTGNQRSERITGISSVFSLSEMICSGNEVSNCFSGPSDQESGNVTGLNTGGIKTTCSKNKISNCFSGPGGQNSGNVTGINTGFGGGFCSNNSVDTLTTGVSAYQSGSAVGIGFEIRTPVAASATCLNNSVHNISTGDAIESGAVVGISSQRNSVCPLEDNSFNVIKNSIDMLYSGNALVRGSVFGIYQVVACNQISCNTITNLSGGEGLTGLRQPLSAGTVGILLPEGNQLSLVGNTISDVVSEPGVFTAGIQLGTIHITGLESSITNSTVSQNSIKNISSMASGFGIAILTEGSYGNSLLSNSISNTSGKAISIVGNVVNGQDASAIPDAIVTLSSVTCTGSKKLRVVGVVQPQANLLGIPFLLQFFVSDTSLPPEAKTLIFEYLLDPSEGNTFDLIFSPAVPTSIGQYISATATAQVEPPAHNWNTSEASNGFPACNSSGAPYVALICPEKSTPPSPFDCDLFIDCSLETNGGDASDIL